MNIALIGQIVSRSLGKSIIVSKEPCDWLRPPAEILALLGVAMKGAIESGAWNRALHLRDDEDSALRFLTKDERAINLPPTNNAAEQAVWSLKVRERCSECFRTETGAQDLLVVQSYTRSALNSGIDPLSALEVTIEGAPWLPADS